MTFLPALALVKNFLYLVVYVLFAFFVPTLITTYFTLDPVSDFLTFTFFSFFVLMKTFVASTGAVDSETPLGVYTVSDRYEALYLVGYVWGQYAVRIEGPYFFHSVPYFTKGEPDWNDLEYLEYNKLGEGASAGCVRLAARDAKWIYDNVPAGTTVEIYDSDELPAGVVKPQAIKIDIDSPYRGWDPTDPNENNPWSKL